MRRADWEYLLVEYAVAQRGRPFVWGETDCFALVREALSVVYDPSPLADVPYYFDRPSALLVLRETGDVSEALHVLGGRCAPARLAQQGDLLAMPGNDGLGLARFAVVVDGRGHVLTSSPADGVEIVDIRSMPDGTMAWRWRP